MDLSRLQETNPLGRFYLKVPGSRKYDTYFQTIEALRPLLNSREWNETVTGYYINTGSNNMDTVRLSYFSSNDDAVRNCAESFCRQYNIVESQSPEVPHATRISEVYGGEELRFRRFLYLYTLIGLDIISADLLNARRLMATFRFQVMLSRQPYQPHFQRTFEMQSPAYNSLSAEQKEQFWLDLANWPNPPQVDWAHFIVNMILPGDFVGPNQWIYFLIQRPALSLVEINNIVINFGFQIRNG